MKHILVLIGLLALGACATLTPNSSLQSVQAQITQTCVGYEMLYTTLTTARESGQIGKSYGPMIEKSYTVMYPYCSGSLPTDQTAAAQRLGAVAGQLALLQSIQKSATTGVTTK